MVSDLAISKKRVEDTLASKGNLLAWICHELRNPLHTIGKAYNISRVGNSNN